MRGLRITLASALMAGMALSHRLWFGPRLYPLTPVLGFFDPLDRLVCGALAACLAALLFSSNRALYAAIFVLIALAALQDQSRWQPWFYQYVMMLLAVALAGPERPRAALHTCCLILAATYLWSGLAKFNPHFAANAWPALAPAALHRFWLAAPVLECATGLGLATTRFRKPAVWCAIAMHLWILAAIGPWGTRFNSVVWPWNAAMIACLLLVYRTGPLWQEPFLFQKVALVLFGILPALSLGNLWDHDLSSSMYSGNRTFGTVYFNDSVFDRLPDAIQDYVTDEGPDRCGLDINEWSLGELNVPSYPEPRVYRNVARAICRYGRHDPSIELVIEEQLALVRGGARRTYHCAN